MSQPRDARFDARCGRTDVEPREDQEDHLGAEPHALIGPDRNGVEQQQPGDHHDPNPAASTAAAVVDLETGTPRQGVRPSSRRSQHHRQADEQAQASTWIDSTSGYM